MNIPTSIVFLYTNEEQLETTVKNTHLELPIKKSLDMNPTKHIPTLHRKTYKMIKEI